VDISLTEAEIVHLAADFEDENERMIGPRLTGRLKIIQAARELLKEIPK
jgi:hypothetical protein